MTKQQRSLSRVQQTYITAAGSLILGLLAAEWLDGLNITSGHIWLRVIVISAVIGLAFEFTMRRRAS